MMQLITLYFRHTGHAQAACSNLGKPCAQCVRMAPGGVCIHHAPWNLHCSSDSAMPHIATLSANDKCW